ncbi:helix-turn-helix transcriptional regulator [Deinococcus yavapaiensis]|uniref:Putative DNA-binding transcriptional regulator YafY n=1 Tax=Deinococcus yavapaiensis KR-236 TaxID=694435 RepID=A0A318S2I5_9DEIO|nr:WYL domain-containing protein [Deinococcus yavapaiensis]PYE49956.1 putative DNA-binding transcriptional regulator YafY [Deinococcus yavapaiensis KR-236]
MTNDAQPEDRPEQERATWTKVKRLLELMELLRLRERTVRELADWFGVEQRHIQRDLQDLQEIGAGLEYVHPHRYRLVGTPESLRPVQALAVHAATRLLYHHAATKNKQYLLALEKLALSLPNSVQDIARRSTQDFRPQLVDDRVFEAVASAWFDRRVVAFDYASPTGEVEHLELAVYFVEVSRDDLAPYAIGFERLKRGEMRAFKLSRMRFVTLLTDTYEIPQDFDPRAHLTDAWGVVGGQTDVVTVRLRFAAEAAYRVLEGGYPSLTVEHIGASDGSIVVSVVASVDETGLPRELLPWLLGWGPRVEILTPENVRRQWLEEMRETLRRYGGEAS